MTDVSIPPHINQTDNFNCGVFVCYFAYQKLKNNSLTTLFSPDKFRELIFNCILKKEFNCDNL